MAQLRLQGAWTLAVLLVALVVTCNVPSSYAQTATTVAATNTTTATNATTALSTANSTLKAPGPAPVKAPGPSPKKAPGPAPKKVSPPPPYYPPSKHRRSAVYGLTFGGIGLFVALLGAVLVYDFVRKTGYFKPKDRQATTAFLDKGEFALNDDHPVAQAQQRV